MKKNETTIKKVVAGKNGKMTLEKLARMMAQGFENTKEELRQEFRQGQSKLEQRQSKLEQGQAEIKQEVEGIKEEVSSIKEDQKDNTRRLISIERKLSGTLLSLDETVHRNEFSKLEHRVEALES